MPMVDPRLTLPALALALGSAALHAAWNLLLARARDVQAATAATFVLAVVIGAPFAAVWWSAETSVWPYALASSLLEAVYALGLAYGYRLNELSFAYPLTRGLAPVLTLLGAAVVLGHATSLLEVAGVLLVAAGVVLVRGPQGHGDAKGLLVVTTTAAAIAAYTLVDRTGIQHAGAFTYYVLVLLGPCLVYPSLVGVAAIRRELGPLTVTAAAAAFASFVLGLLALRRGGAAPVLAVRSSSIVITTLLARRVLREDVKPGRIAGSVVVFAGVVLLAI
jgi:drug/metabolite transporter (DMT)-like permease